MALLQTFSGRRVTGPMDGADLLPLNEASLGVTILGGGPTPTPALSSAFSTNLEKQKQWKGYIRKSHLKDTPGILDTIVQDLNNFLGPLVVTMADNGMLFGRWAAEGGWKS